MPAPHETSPATASPTGTPDEPYVPPKRARWFVYTDASSLGIEIAVAVTAGAVGGYYVERYLTHWSPWTMLIGFALGVVVAVKAVLRTSRAYRASLRRDAAEQAALEAKEASALGGPPGEPRARAEASAGISSPARPRDADAPASHHARHPSDEHEQAARRERNE